MYRIIACDLDETLLNSDHQVSDMKERVLKRSSIRPDSSEAEGLPMARP